MRPILRAAGVASLTLAALPLVSFRSAGAQLPCALANRAVSSNAEGTEAPDILRRKITLHAGDISLRSALDRIATAARIRISYSRSEERRAGTGGRASGASRR